MKTFIIITLAAITLATSVTGTAQSTHFSDEYKQAVWVWMQAERLYDALAEGSAWCLLVNVDHYQQTPRDQYECLAKDILLREGADRAGRRALEVINNPEDPIAHVIQAALDVSTAQKHRFDCLNKRSSENPFGPGYDEAGRELDNAITREKAAMEYARLAFRAIELDRERPSDSKPPPTRNKIPEHL